MIYVRYEEPNTAEYKKWKARALKKREEHLESFRKQLPFKVSDALYKARKQDLFAQFHKKCAYCEINLLEGQPGNVEHYRPKGAIKNLDQSEVTCPPNNAPHPGYFWLAYDWRNLLPACTLCNSPNSHPVIGSFGKWDYFPVGGGRVNGPDANDAALAAEDALIIHPRFQDPADHLELELETGALRHKTPQGKATIQILGLNRPDLMAARYTALVSARAAIANLVTLMLAEPPPNPTAAFWRSQLAAIHSGEAKHAMVGRIALAQFNQIKERLRF